MTHGHAENAPADFGPGPVPSAVMGLLQLLPPAGAEWRAEDRQRWLEALRTTIEACYPESRGPEGALR